MESIWYHPLLNPQAGNNGLRQHLPGASVHVWQPGNSAPVDYAIVRSPPGERLMGRTLKVCRGSRR